VRGIVSPVFLPDADLFVFTYYEVDERCLIYAWSEYLQVFRVVPDTYTGVGM